MIRSARNLVVAIALAGLVLQGCAGTGADPDRLQPFQAQLFDTSDPQQALRAVLVTLRDHIATWLVWRLHSPLARCVADRDFLDLKLHRVGTLIQAIIYHYILDNDDPHHLLRS